MSNNHADRPIREVVSADISIRQSREYSSFGQDAWVLIQLKQKRNGFFVDCGAATPKVINNTWRLENEFGWDGICIEPNAYFFEQLEEVRAATCVQIALSNYTGTATLKQGAYGTSLKDTDFPTRKWEEVVVDVDLLINVLRDCGAPQIIDYIDLDVPGSELSVLQGFDFSQYTPLLITVKNIPQDADAITALLVENGFTRDVDLGIDMSFINDNIKEYVD